MPGHLRYFQVDPNRKGRGTGWYYHRGHGYYSKWSEGLDRARRKGPMLVGKKYDRYKHTTDFPAQKGKLTSSVKKTGLARHWQQYRE